MGRLTDAQKCRILKLHRERKGVVAIVKDLRETCGTSCTRQAVRNFLIRFQQRGSIANEPSTVRPSKILSPVIQQFIDKSYEANDEITAPDLQQLLQHKFGITVSLATIKRARKTLGWLSAGTKYCQLVREPNRAKRLAFARKCQDDGETFDNVIFTDECTVAMESNLKLSFRRWWEPPKLKGKPKHPYKVHVWAGISKRGATTLAVFGGIMESTFFTEDLLSKSLMPFIRETFPDGHRFQQDNDPKHTSKLTQKFIDDNNINWWKTPPESPDMNPIELVWHEMKHYLRKHVKPKTKEELMAGLEKFWEERMTPDKCAKYISHLRKVIPKVIEREGRASGY